MPGAGDFRNSDYTLTPRGSLTQGRSACQKKLVPVFCRRLPVVRPLSTGADVARYRLLGFILNAVSQPNHPYTLCVGVEEL